MEGHLRVFVNSKDCGQHVGITDWDKERLKMSIKMPASWSPHALRKCLGIPSGTAALRVLTRLIVLLTSASENLITQSIRTAGALMQGSFLFSLTCVKSFSAHSGTGDMLVKVRHHMFW